MLVRTNVPSGLVVSVEDAKAHLIVEHGDDDALIEGYIEAAQLVVEDQTQRMLRPGTFELRLDGWYEPLCIPIVPIRDVTAIAYLDSDHDEQLLAGSDWSFETTPNGAEIWFADTFDAPTLSSRNLPVRVRFSAGYDLEVASGSGDDPETSPDRRARQVILQIVAHWYAVREPVTVGNVVNEIPLAAERLMEQMRIFR